MSRKRLCALLVSVMTFLAIGITALAATCPYCANSGYDVTLQSTGEHLWDHVSTHTVQYSEGGVLKTESCTVTTTEDRDSYVCPKGHGVISSRTHHRETHSSKYCNDLDYWY